VSKTRIIFIASSGRSGSKSVAITLRKELHNTQVTHAHKPRFERENCLKYKGEFEKDPKAFLRHARAKYVRQAKRANKHYIETPWFISAFIEDLPKAFPNCEIYHLVRDGRDFLRSGYRRPWFKPQHKFANSNNAWTRNHWNPPLEARTRFEKIAWLWAEQQRVMIEQFNALPEKNKGKVLRLEDLLEGGKYHLLGELALIDIVPDMWIRLEHIGKSPSHKLDHFSNWSQEQKDLAEKWMGNELDYFGYKNQRNE